MALAIMPMYTLFMTLYRNVDKITDLVTENVAKLPKEQEEQRPEIEVSKPKSEVLYQPSSQQDIGLKMEKEEVWSKERIKAEMDDLMWAKYIRLGIAIIFLLIGTVTGIGFLFALGALLTVGSYGYGFGGYGAAIGAAVIGTIIFYLIVIIVSFIIGLFFLKGYREKSRRYDELKAKL